MSRDAELAKQIADRDPIAMERLIDHYGERIRRTIGQLTAWGPDVDDLTQETLLRVWKYAKNYRGEGTLEKWLVSIAFRVCRDHQRRIQRMLGHFQKFWKQTLLPPTTPESSMNCNVDDQWETVQLAMEKLSASDRLILVMIHVEHWTHEELAQQMNLSVDTLHVRLHRARSRLKQWLSHDGELRDE